jgi:lactoylglutathione lyase
MVLFNICKTSELKLAFLGINGEIIEGYNANLPAEGKVHHVAFTVEGIEREKERLQSLGVLLV